MRIQSVLEGTKNLPPGFEQTRQATKEEIKKLHSQIDPESCNNLSPGAATFARDQLKWYSIFQTSKSTTEEILRLDEQLRTARNSTLRRIRDAAFESTVSEIRQKFEQRELRIQSQLDNIEASKKRLNSLIEHGIKRSTDLSCLLSHVMSVVDAKDGLLEKHVEQQLGDSLRIESLSGNMQNVQEQLVHENVPPRRISKLTTTQFM